MSVVPLLPSRRRVLDMLLTAIGPATDASDHAGGPRLVLVTAPPGGGLTSFLRALQAALDVP